jgi:hypothetical protein
MPASPLCINKEGDFERGGPCKCSKPTELSDKEKTSYENGRSIRDYVSIKWTDFAKACLDFIRGSYEFSLPSDFIEEDWLASIALFCGAINDLKLYQLYCLLDNTTAATIEEEIDTWTVSNENHLCLHTCGNGSIVVEQNGKYFLQTCAVHVQFGMQKINMMRFAGHATMGGAEDSEGKTFVSKTSFAAAELNTGTRKRKFVR